MTPALEAFIRAVFALAFVVGLISLSAWAFRKYAPKWLEKLQADRGARRLKVVETLVLDPTRRLVLVTFDDRERLFLLGEGSELTPASTAQPKAKPLPKPAPRPASETPASPLVTSLAKAITRRSAPK